MDVRFSGQALHCQLGRTELERLVSGRAVDLVVALPRHHAFRVSIRPSVMTAERGGWQLDSDPTGIWVTVPRAELEQLGQTTTFAERLLHDFPVTSDANLQLILEVIPDSAPAERSVLEITPQLDLAE
ncbi:hypothetical protein [Steroidobacter sp.]|uniref:hypothetical protein n=1 Tax=Steroidobacter sp. TaxID=1978227 RepID=UPI001A5F6841|nr:hypothetical protein [Steroidobacter sp.]MBL8268683.1 hypothetical protein [Steroidobacter sp.]